MKSTSLPLVQFNVASLPVQFDIRTGAFRVHARPSQEFLDNLVPSQWVGLSCWDDPKSTIRVRAYAANGNEGSFVKPDSAGRWICFVSNREDLVKLLENGF